MLPVRLADDVLLVGAQTHGRAVELRVQSSLNQKQRLQQLFLPEGVRFDGKRPVGTGLTLPVFNYFAPAEDSEVRIVGPPGIEPGTP